MYFFNPILCICSILSCVFVQSYLMYFFNPILCIFFNPILCIFSIISYVFFQSYLMYFFQSYLMYFFQSYLMYFFQSYLMYFFQSYLMYFFQSYEGLKMSGVQHMNPWDLLEDYKSVAPLSWASFGAVRIEKRPSRYLEQAKKLLHHTHQRRRPITYYTNYEIDDDDDDDSDAEVKEADRHSQPPTPNTPGGRSFLSSYLLK